MIMNDILDWHLKLVAVRVDNDVSGALQVRNLESSQRHRYARRHDYQPNRDIAMSLPKY
jgi:hypothetical protein